MATFAINDTDFGINGVESVARLNVRGDGSSILTLDVTGDETVYQAIAEREDSEWSWSLYPPRFYLVDYNLAPCDQSRAGEITLAPEDYDEYDLALYMMEHNQVSAIVIELHQGCEVSVSGIVDLMGEEKTFRIRCKLEGS
jgi:hypothetical protein